MYDSQFPAVHIMRMAPNQLVTLQKIMDQIMTLGACLDASRISSTRCRVPSDP